MKILKFSHGPGQARSFKNKPKGKCKKKGGDLEKRKRGISVRKSIFYFQRPRSLEVGFSRTRGSQLIYMYIYQDARDIRREQTLFFFPHPDPPTRESLLRRTRREERANRSVERATSSNKSSSSDRVIYETRS